MKHKLEIIKKYSVMSHTSELNSLTIFTIGERQVKHDIISLVNIYPLCLMM